MLWERAFLYWPVVRRKEWVVAGEVQLELSRADLACYGFGVPPSGPVVRVLRCSGEVTNLPRRCWLVVQGPEGQALVQWTNQTRSALRIVLEGPAIRPPRGAAPIATDRHRSLVDAAMAEA